MVDRQKKAVKPPVGFRSGVLLAPYTTLKVGGQVAWFGVVRSVEEIEAAVRFAHKQALPFRVIGGGSNLLVPDSGFPGVVVQNALKGIVYTTGEGGMVEVTIGAGEVLDDVIADMVTRGYSGLENLSAIPGTVGATPIQNVGAYGVEVAHYISAVTCYHVLTNSVVKLTHADCMFGYRDSFFKSPAGKEYVILSVTFQLSTKFIPQISYADLARTLTASAALTDIRNMVIHIRSQKFPNWRETGTAGSFFKNPIITKAHAEQLSVTYSDIPVYPVSDTEVKVSLGYILDKVCNLKGYEQDGVSLYSKQALVLVNEQPHTEVINRFASHVADVVYAKTQIVIEREVTELV